MRQLAAVAASVLVAACVSVPPAANEMDNARSAYRLAASNQQVQARAPVELQLAQRALGDAERLQGADADPTMVAHFAYLAEQRARIAIKTAELRETEAAMATAGEQRNRMRAELSAREREQALTQKRDADLQIKQAQVAAEQAAAQKRASEERASQLNSEVSRLQGELKARETDRGTVLTLGNDVLFDSGDAVLKPGGRKAVDNLAALMQKQPGRSVGIEGFTDTTGSPETNRRLSEARAAAVKQALVERGVDSARIQTRGMGSSFPIASNETAVGRQLNRRVEVVFAPQSGASSAGGTTR
jgi:outer membrane protein OmpA-like peptidoglycan-associated protein